jgi:hypothetical protein
MTLMIHLGHRTGSRTHQVPRVPPGDAAPAPAPALESADAGERPIIDERVFAVQRLGAVIVGVLLLVFGLLGFASRVPFLSTHGERIVGLSSNGLLAAVSVVVAAILIGAALRGPRIASTVMIVVGTLFLLSALGNLALLRTSFNILAFRMSNVLFSVVAGLLLLVLGSYGRLSGNLPDDSPYAHPHAWNSEPPDLPSTPEEIAAEAAMRQAEIAVAEHHATEDQRRRVLAMARVRTRDGRRRVWMEFADSAGTPPNA